MTLQTKFEGWPCIFFTLIIQLGGSTQLILVNQLMYYLDISKQNLNSQLFANLLSPLGKRVLKQNYDPWLFRERKQQAMKTEELHKNYLDTSEGQGRVGLLWLPKRDNGKQTDVSSLVGHMMQCFIWFLMMWGKESEVRKEKERPLALRNYRISMK